MRTGTGDKRTQERFERMKIGFVLFDYFPYGGLQRDCLKTAALCAKRGHTVTLLTRSWQGVVPSDVSVRLFDCHGFTTVAGIKHFTTQLTRELPRLELDGLVGFNRVTGLDVYYGAERCFAAMLRNRAFWLRWLPRYRYYLAAESLIFGRQYQTKILLLTAGEIPLYQGYYGTRTDRFEVLPPGIPRRTSTEEQRVTARTRIRASNGWPKDARLILFVGSGFRIKGLDRAIIAFAALPDTILHESRLAIIGQDAASRFAKLARRLGVSERVHFLGGRDDVPDWQLAADLQFHPAYTESAGMVLLEALAAGLPVLTTDTCGYAFHIEAAQAGVVLKSPFIQEECNRALLEMLTARSRDEWRRNGLAYAADEDLYSCHQRVVEITEATLQRKLQPNR